MVAFFGGKKLSFQRVFVRYYSTNKKIHYFYHLQFQSLKTKSKKYQKILTLKFKQNTIKIRQDI